MIFLLWALKLLISASRCSKTLQGVPCNFPFGYNNERYDKCALYEQGKSFCTMWFDFGTNIYANPPSGPCEPNCENGGK